jgi:hypothetical protein
MIQGTGGRIQETGPGDMLQKYKVQWTGCRIQDTGDKMQRQATKDKLQDKR